ncbi:outer membrane beta-barrel protein [Gemmatimonas sp.]|uniref:outer membrane beta-barrel protein n=1 Tax=Gemmatimonas sp. TaxID=1962908 RepID=UPI00391940C3
MTRMLRAALAAATLSTTAAASAEAQSGKGLFVGIQYAGASVNVKDAADDLEFGSGFGVHAGLGLSERWSVLGNFDRSVLTGNSADVRLTQYDALLRLQLIGAASPVKLFVTGGATARSANAGRDFEGIAPTGGGGVQLFLSSGLAVHGTALWTFGNLTRANQLSGNTIDQQFTSTGTRVQAGASLYLFGR